MLKPFLKDTALYGIGSIAIRLINFVLMPFLTRRLSTADYGVITLLLTLAPIVLYVLTLQVSQAIPKFCANNPNPTEKQEYISSAFWYVLFSYVIFYVVAVSVPSLSQWILGTAVYHHVFQLALINICLFGLFTYLETQLRWDQKAFEFVIVTVVMLLASMILIVALVYFGLGLSGYFIGSAIAQLIGCIVAYIYSRHQYRFVLSAKRLKMMLHFTFPLSISAVGSYVYANITQWLIRYFCSLHDVGIYGVASRFGSLVSVAFGCVAMSVTTLIYAKHDKAEMPAFISFLFRMCLLFTLFATVVFEIFGTKILHVLVGQSFMTAKLLIPLIMISYALASFYIFTPGQWLRGKTGQMAKINLLGGAVSIVLAYYLAKSFLVMGAVVGLCIASIIQFGLNIYFSNKYYKINYHLSSVLIVSIFFFGMYLIQPSVLLWCIFIVVSTALLFRRADVHLMRAIK